MALGLKIWTELASEPAGCGQPLTEPTSGRTKREAVRMVGLFKV